MRKFIFFFLIFVLFFSVQHPGNSPEMEMNCNSLYGQYMMMIHVKNSNSPWAGQVWIDASTCNIVQP